MQYHPLWALGSPIRIDIQDHVQDGIHAFRHVLDYATSPPLHLITEGCQIVSVTDTIFSALTQIFSKLPIVVQIPLQECDSEIDEIWIYVCKLMSCPAGCLVECKLQEMDARPEGQWSLSIFTCDKIKDFAGWYNLNLMRNKDVFVMTDDTAPIHPTYFMYREFALREGLHAQYKIYIRDGLADRSFFTLQTIQNDLPVILDPQYMETIGLPVIAAEYEINFEPNPAHFDLEECVHTPSFSQTYEIQGSKLKLHMIAVIDLLDTDPHPSLIWEEFTESFCEAHREEKMMLQNGDTATVNKYFLNPNELDAYSALEEYEGRLVSKFKNLCSTSNESYRDFGLIQAQVRNKILGARKLRPTNI